MSAQLAVAERGIIFQSDMILALLAGKKTQTRRAVKPRSLVDISSGGTVYVAGDRVHRCPYGKPGDVLWPREAFRFPVEFDADSPSRVGERCVDAGYRLPWAPIQYEADGQRKNWERDSGAPGKLRPGLFMPRWAARMRLEITAIRVEPLQDISEADAIAEGLTACGAAWEYRDADGRQLSTIDPRIAYAALVNRINGEGFWASNPWVWCISFKRAEP